MDRKTVLISGVGIAGPTLAFWLNAAGFEVTLVESSPTLRAGGYVIDFWGPGYDIAERMGLREAVESASYHMHELRIVDESGKRSAGFGVDVFRELTGGRYVTLGRSELSRLLYGQIRDTAETIFGDEIASLEEEPDGVRVAFGKAMQRKFDLVIGADGLHSQVRKLAFGPQQSFESDLGYRVAAFEATGYRPRDDGVYVMYNESGCMLGRVALREDRTLFLFVFAAAPAERAPAHDPASQKALLCDKYGSGHWEYPRILAELDRAETLYFDRVSQIKMNAWSKGRVALVGDSAFCVSLLAGQGSALAMTAAYVLAGELARAKGDHTEAFTRYETLLRSYIMSKQRAATGFASAFAPRTQWGLWLRNLVINAAAIPGFARLVFGTTIVDALHLPEYRCANQPRPQATQVSTR